MRTSRDVSSSLTLFCLHGNSSHRGIWRPVAEQLPEYRSVLVDLRGSGDSDHVSPPVYNPEHHAAEIAAIISGGLIKQPYAILGHSVGALAAVHFIAAGADAALVDTSRAAHPPATKARAAASSFGPTSATSPSRRSLV